MVLGEDSNAINWFANFFEKNKSPSKPPSKSVESKKPSQTTRMRSNSPVSGREELFDDYDATLEDEIAAETVENIDTDLSFVDDGVDESRDSDEDYNIDEDDPDREDY